MPSFCPKMGLISILMQNSHESIETITDRSKPAQIMPECLGKWENFWIKSFETLQPQGVNHKVNP